MDCYYQLADISFTVTTSEKSYTKYCKFIPSILQTTATASCTNHQTWGGGVVYWTGCGEAYGAGEDGSRSLDWVYC